MSLTLFVQSWNFSHSQNLPINQSNNSVGRGRRTDMILFCFACLECPFLQGALYCILLFCLAVISNQSVVVLNNEYSI